MGWMVRVMMVWVAALLFALPGCGGGDAATTTPAATDTVDGLVTGMGWIYENVPSDLSTHPLGLRVFLYYSETVHVSDIDSFTVTAPTGETWTLPAATGRFETTSTGKGYMTGRLIFDGNSFPLAGTWTAQVRLKDGSRSSYLQTLHEPGSATAASHQFVYARDDLSPDLDASQYVAALSRFPSQGYTVRYSATDGGSITTAGLAPVTARFLASEPAAYNMFCWLYDGNQSYLGYTIRQYAVPERSSTGLVTAVGELSITPASTTGASGPVDLSQVKYLRFVYQDGGQFAPNFDSFDYRSVSALVPVN